MLDVKLKIHKKSFDFQVTAKFLTVYPLQYHRRPASKSSLYKSLPCLTNLYRMGSMPVMESSYGGWNASEIGHPAHQGGFMRHMTSFIAKAFFTILISGGMLAASAQAQYMNGAEATVPFAFSAQSQSMAAGNYEIKLLPDPFLLAIHKAGTGGDLIFMVRPEDGQSVPSHGYLIFRRDADHLYLAEIHLPGTHTYSVLIQKREPNTADVKIALSNSSANTTLR
jgi:hypothetical protein